MLNDTATHTHNLYHSLINNHLKLGKPVSSLQKIFHKIMTLRAIESYLTFQKHRAQIESDTRTMKEEEEKERQKNNDFCFLSF